ncbi:MAG: hypothetical protein J7M25_08175 [Deltaproteobacteria bacterium]|nr:hypothetical protein [Deltaproteobacteria bacterium]
MPATQANPDNLRTQLLDLALPLSRWRRTAVVLARTGPTLAGIILVSMMAAGVAAPSWPLVPIVCGLAVLFLGARIAQAILPASRQAIIDGLGRTDHLAGLTSAALDLTDDIEATDGGNEPGTHRLATPRAQALALAHIEQTLAALETARPTKMLSAGLVDRLQITAVLLICAVSVALL